jgi:hypothetical protein
MHTACPTHAVRFDLGAQRILAESATTKLSAASFYLQISISTLCSKTISMYVPWSEYFFLNTVF